MTEIDTKFGFRHFLWVFRYRNLYLSHKVVCSHDGCPWKGPYRSLAAHFGACGFALEECKHCLRQFKKLEGHNPENCGAKPVGCDYAKDFKRVTYPKGLRCEFSVRGCDWKGKLKNQAAHHATCKHRSD